jgi:hypothetical protein
MNRKMGALERIKAFGMTNQMLVEDLSRIAAENKVDLGHMMPAPSELDAAYYPQFASDVRSEASSMAKHYEVFYCLETSIRRMVSESLGTSTGLEDWWDTDRVPSHIKQEVHARIKTEVDAGVTRRSLDELDYTTFGELSQIIVSNWDVFGGPLNSKKAVERVMANLNSLRNPIAHCSPLAEDEALRLSLTMRDWFRLME